MVIVLAMPLVGIGFYQLQPAIAQQQQPEVNLTSTEKESLLDGIVE